MKLITLMAVERTDKMDNNKHILMRRSCSPLGNGATNPSTNSDERLTAPPPPTHTRAD